MIRPVLKSVDCYDLQYGDLPSDVTDFSYEINALIGELGSDGTNIFVFSFCSHKALPHRNAKGKDLRLNVIESFDWKFIENYIQQRCDLSVGYDWLEACRKLCQWSFWEYENYRL